MKRWYALGTLLMIIGLVMGLRDTQDKERMFLPTMVIILGVVILFITAIVHMGKRLAGPKKSA